MFADTEAFFILLIYSLLVGVSLGILYDTITLMADIVFPKRALNENGKRRLGADALQAGKTLFPYKWSFGSREITLIILDIIFWLISALTVIILLYHLNYGQIRAFSLAMALVGFTVYKKTVGKPIRALSMKALKISFHILKKTTKKLLSPMTSVLKRVLVPRIRKIRLANARRKAKKYLFQMQLNEIKSRKTKNERSKGIGSD